LSPAPDQTGLRVPAAPSGFRATRAWFIPVVAALFGAVVGSFLNVVIYRLPAGESVVFPGSRCPRCGSPIRPWDNIPVLGWLLLRGRCRDCRDAIALRYPLVELANSLLWAALALRFGASFAFFALAAFCSALLVITLIDVDHWIIPDAITLPGIAIGLAASFFLPPRGGLLADVIHDRLRLAHLPGLLASPGFWDSLLALAIGGGFFYLVAAVSRGGWAAATSSSRHDGAFSACATSASRSSSGCSRGRPSASR
jgi:prepilin signal peptidase PulO-like enzyme (type II secretory pathway)